MSEESDNRMVHELTGEFLNQIGSEELHNPAFKIMIDQ